MAKDTIKLVVASAISTGLLLLANRYWLVMFITQMGVIMFIIWYQDNSEED